MFKTKLSIKGTFAINFHASWHCAYMSFLEPISRIIRPHPYNYASSTWDIKEFARTQSSMPVSCIQPLSYTQSWMSCHADTRQSVLSVIFPFWFLSCFYRHEMVKVFWIANTLAAVSIGCSNLPYKEHWSIQSKQSVYYLIWVTSVAVTACLVYDGSHDANHVQQCKQILLLMMWVLICSCCRQQCHNHYRPETPLVANPRY